MFAYLQVPCNGYIKNAKNCDQVYGGYTVENENFLQWSPFDLDFERLRLILIKRLYP